MPDPIQTLHALAPEEQHRLRSEVRVLILTGLGLNCEDETAAGFRMAGARVDQVHLLDWLNDGAARKLTDYSILAFIGGFAFGDHLGAGFVFANKIRWRLYDSLLEFIEQGGLSLGICNGFQTMVRLGMLPGLDRDYRTPRAALVANEKLGYRNAWIQLNFDPDSPCVWTRGLSKMDLPSRHGEGRFITESPELLERMEKNGQIATRYIDAEGRPTESWPANPNGSAKGVAGICDPSGRLFGMMPHPDAYLYPYQHPDWSLLKAQGKAATEGAGMRIFKNGVDAAAATLMARGSRTESGSASA